MGSQDIKVKKIGFIPKKLKVSCKRRQMGENRDNGRRVRSLLSLGLEQETVGAGGKNGMGAAGNI